MKMIFKLQGLDCANCTAKIERALAKLDGVTSASVNFLTTKMVLEADGDRIDEIAQSARDIVRRFEPHVVVQKA